MSKLCLAKVKRKLFFFSMETQQWIGDHFVFFTCSRSIIILHFMLLLLFFCSMNKSKVTVCDVFLFSSSLLQNSTELHKQTCTRITCVRHERRFSWISWVFFLWFVLLVPILFRWQFCRHHDDWDPARMRPSKLPNSSTRGCQWWSRYKRIQCIQLQRPSSTRNPIRMIDTINTTKEKISRTFTQITFITCDTNKKVSNKKCYSLFNFAFCTLYRTLSSHRRLRHFV